MSLRAAASLMSNSDRSKCSMMPVPCPLTCVMDPRPRSAVQRSEFTFKVAPSRSPTQDAPTRRDGINSHLWRSETNISVGHVGRARLTGTSADRLDRAVQQMPRVGRFRLETTHFLDAQDLLECALLHHRDPFAQVPHHPKVMRDH